MHTVSCITSPDNAGSVAFHRAMGFSVVPGRAKTGGPDVQENYDGHGLDRVVFSRHLGALTPMT